MRLPRLFLLAGLLLAVLPLRADLDEDQPPVPIKVSTVPYQIAPLDSIKVKAVNGTVQTYQVAQDGTLSLDDQGYPVQGLDPGALRQLVRRHLGPGGSISIQEFRANRVTILGEVFHQIFTDMGDGPMRVLDAIASANGFTPLANTRRVRLVRENAGHVEVYELDLREVLRGRKSNQNILVEPGDVITVPRNFL